jgi:hypothetical protein
MPLNATLVSDTLVQSVAAGLFGGWMVWKITEKNYQSSLMQLKLTKSSESN